MKILVVGKGHMGKILEKELPNTVLYPQRIQQMEQKDLEGYNVVINTAAKTDLPWCESNAREAFEHNVECAFKLGRFCCDVGLPLIQFSSGCIWKGPYTHLKRPFRPTSPADPACFYSWTKVAAEGILLREFVDGLHILRPRQVYSDEPSPRNTLWKLNSYPKLLDTPNSMTSSATIQKCISRIIEDEDTLYSNRVWNLYDLGITSPFKVGMMLFKRGLRKKPKKLEKKDLDTWHKPQRVDVVMEDYRMERVVDPPNVNDELERMIDLFAKNLKKKGKTA